ncbi:hypothetical protein OTK49_00085 [Vibrio coralliirubri]|uniref:hypothetical protein n=1 Tax=Vibrio coralliirubri TaxID=1516159 RepID=UPI0022847411|nr:hypothetical protein [Vibrio coralliirubri]MCY9860938.1 hypothetical protein [Vibrio coralliirubri]
MSALDALLNDVKKPSGNNNSTNILVTVDEWEDNQVKGVRMDTGEQIVVRLNKFEKKPDAPFDRPDLMAIKAKYRSSAGAIVFFETCYHNADDGVWYARWASLIKKSTKDQKTAAVILKSKVTIGKSTRGKEYIEIKALVSKYGHPVPYQTIETMDELRSIAEAHLKPIGNGVTPYLLVFASDGEKDFSFEIKATLIETTTDDGEKQFVVDPNAENSLNKYLESRYGAVLPACIEHPDVQIKVAKGKVIYCGTATRDSKLKGNKGEFLKKEFTIDEEGGYVHDNIGYKDVVVGVREDADINTKYAVFLSSLKPFDKAISAKELLA